MSDASEKLNEANSLIESIRVDVDYIEPAINKNAQQEDKTEIQLKLLKLLGFLASVAEEMTGLWERVHNLEAENGKYFEEIAEKDGQIQELTLERNGLMLDGIVKEQCIEKGKAQIVDDQQQIADLTAEVERLKKDIFKMNDQCVKIRQGLERQIADQQALIDKLVDACKLALVAPCGSEESKMVCRELEAFSPRRRRRNKQ